MASTSNFVFVCPSCFHESEPGSIHCFRVVNVKGVIGWVGCHEEFADAAALALHQVGNACRSPENPICNLQWDGIQWRVKEKEDNANRKR